MITRDGVEAIGSPEAVGYVRRRQKLRRRSQQRLHFSCSSSATCDPLDSSWPIWAMFSVCASPCLHCATPPCMAPRRDALHLCCGRFQFALWEMSRMYAYQEMEVIVLPQKADPSLFPSGPTAWGLVSPQPYSLRGWCCSEYNAQ